MAQVDLYDFYRNKRFLFIIGQYDNLGGSERQAILLASEIANKTSACIDFLAWGGDGIVAQKIRHAGFRPLVFNLNWNQQRWKKYFMLRRLARFVREEVGPDYLLPYIGFNCKVAALISSAVDAKFTWWNQRDEGRDIFGSKLELKIIRRLPAVVSNSVEGINFLSNTFGLNRSDVILLNNGIVLPDSNPDFSLRTKLGLRADALVISMLANHTRFKDHATLIRAFKILVDEIGNRPVSLILAGRYDEMTLQLKCLCFDLGLCGKVHFPGILDPPDELWKCTDIAVHSSTTEGCPNAALEAMAHARCLCGTDVPGMRQALGESLSKTCLAKAGDARGLAEILVQLANDTVIRAEQGAMNRLRIASEFSPRQLCDRTLAIIRTACG